MPQDKWISCQDLSRMLEWDYAQLEDYLLCRKLICYECTSYDEHKYSEVTVEKLRDKLFKAKIEFLKYRGRLACSDYPTPEDEPSLRDLRNSIFVKINDVICLAKKEELNIKELNSKESDKLSDEKLAFIFKRNRNKNLSYFLKKDLWRLWEAVTLLTNNHPDRVLESRLNLCEDFSVNFDDFSSWFDDFNEFPSWFDNINMSINQPINLIGGLLKTSILSGKLNIVRASDTYEDSWFEGYVEPHAFLTWSKERGYEIPQFLKSLLEKPLDKVPDIAKDTKNLADGENQNDFTIIETESKGEKIRLSTKHRYFIQGVACIIWKTMPKGSSAVAVANHPSFIKATEMIIKKNGEDYSDTYFIDCIRECELPIDPRSEDQKPGSPKRSKN